MVVTERYIGNTWKKIPGSNWDLNQGLRSRIRSRIPVLLPTELLETIWQWSTMG